MGFSGERACVTERGDGRVSGPNVAKSLIWAETENETQSRSMCLCLSPRSLFGLERVLIFERL